MPPRHPGTAARTRRVAPRTEPLEARIALAAHADIVYLSAPVTSTVASVVSYVAQVVDASSSGSTPTGTVSFFDGAKQVGSAPLVAGKATLPFAIVNRGHHALRASYSGDSLFAANTSNTVDEVAQAQSYTALSKPTGPFVQGADNLVTATVTPEVPVFPAGLNFTPLLDQVAANPTPPPLAGYVVFIAGNRDVPGGSTVLGTAPIDPSTGMASVLLSRSGVKIPITAIYTGDALDLTSTATTNLTVNPTPTTATLSVSQPVATAGQSVTLAAMIGVPPSVHLPANGENLEGTRVTFTDGGATLGTGVVHGGTATLTTGPLAAGAHAIVAHYLGLDVPIVPEQPFGSLVIDASVSAPATLTVVPASTFTSLTSSALKVTAGAPVSYTATVGTYLSGLPTPAGSVVFFDGTTRLGSATLSGGRATLTVSAGAAGQAHWITAIYTGGTGTGMSSSPIVFEMVGAATSPVAASPALATASPVVANAAILPTGVLVSAYVPAAAPGLPAPTGSIAVSSGGRALGSAALHAGLGTLLLPSADRGRTLTIFYGGDPAHRPALTSLVVA